MGLGLKLRFARFVSYAYGLLSRDWTQQGIWENRIRGILASNRQKRLRLWDEGTARVARATALYGIVSGAATPLVVFGFSLPGVICMIPGAIIGGYTAQRAGTWEYSRLRGNGVFRGAVFGTLLGTLGGVLAGLVSGAATGLVVGTFFAGSLLLSEGFHMFVFGVPFFVSAMMAVGGALAGGVAGVLAGAPIGCFAGVTSESPPLCTSRGVSSLPPAAETLLVAAPDSRAVVEDR